MNSWAIPTFGYQPSVPGRTSGSSRIQRVLDGQMKSAGDLWGAVGTSLGSYVANPVSRYLNDSQAKAVEAFRKGKACYTEKLYRKAFKMLSQAMEFEALSFADQCHCNYLLGASLYHLKVMNDCESGHESSQCIRNIHKVNANVKTKTNKTHKSEKEPALVHLDRAARAIRSDTPHSVQYGIGFYRGIMLRSLGQLLQSEQCLRLAISIAEVEQDEMLIVNGWYELGLTLDAMQQFGAVREYMGRVLEKRPDHMSGKLLLCAALLGLGLNEQVLQYIDGIDKDNGIGMDMDMDVGEKGTLMEMKAVALFRVSSFEKCLQVLEQAVDIRPCSYYYLRQLQAMACFKCNRYSLAVKYLFGGQFPPELTDIATRLDSLSLSDTDVDSNTDPIPVQETITIETRESSKTLEFICPISKSPMSDPVVASDGYSYERSALEEWIGNSNVNSPVTGMPLEDLSIRDNHTLRGLIEELSRDEEEGDI